MNKKTTDTEIVFKDLSKTYQELSQQQSNPDLFRRRFNIFVSLSQKLTDCMRKEYQTLTNKKWEASLFPGWTNITNLFKELRNTDIHELPLRIKVEQIQTFELLEIEYDKLGNQKVTPVEADVYMVYNIETGFDEELPPMFGVDLINPITKKNENLAPKTCYYKFSLEGRTPKLEKLLKEIGYSDLHELSKHCFDVLNKYYEFYKSQLISNKISE